MAEYTNLEKIRLQKIEDLRAEGVEGVPGADAHAVVAVEGQLPPDANVAAGDSLDRERREPFRYVPDVFGDRSLLAEPVDAVRDLLDGPVLDEPRQRLYVSFWAQAEVAVIDLRTHAITAPSLGSRWAAGSR